MFSEGFFSISFEGLLGLAVTIVSVYFIVKQLRETKLATQMEGLLSVAEQLNEIADLRESLLEVVEQADWHILSNQEAHARVYQSETRKIAYKKTKNFYELVAVLVKGKSLDRNLASKYFGNSVAIWWRRLEKVTLHESDELNYNVAESWEWLALELEKMSG